jgi:hypothetical protein
VKPLSSVTLLSLAFDDRLAVAIGAILSVDISG